MDKFKVIAILLLGFIIGFFSGREHLKYEIKSTISNAFSNKFSSSSQKNTQIKDIPSSNRNTNKTSENSKEEELRVLNEEKLNLLDDLKKAEDAISKIDEYKKKCKEDAEMRKKVLLRVKYVSEYGMLKQTGVKVKITNKTNIVLSGAYFSMTLYSEGRTMPYEEGKIRISIQGGLEPGESDVGTYSLSHRYNENWKIPGVDSSKLKMKSKLISLYDDKETELFSSYWDNDKEDKFKKILAVKSELEDKISNVEDKIESIK